MMESQPGNIASPQNPLVQGYLPNKRHKAGLSYVEGERLVREALNGSWPLRHLILETAFAQTAAGKEFAREAERRGFPVVRMANRAIVKISSSPSPPPLGAIVAPSNCTLDTSPAAPPRLLVLDRLQNPGNAGTLVRCAVGFGFAAVLTVGGVTVGNEKFLRATSGTAFHPGKLFQERPEAVAGFLNANGYRCLVMDSAGGRNLDTLDVSEGGQPLALVLGNEAAGIDDSLWGSMERICIPMAEGVESLNVAMTGAIALYELSRKRPQ